jgi:hypothetical protein
MGPVSKEREMNRPPDDRLDGPIHEWFGLSYSNYQVCHRALMQSMPLGWQQRMVACLSELADAFEHVVVPDYYIVTPARESTYGQLSDYEAYTLQVTRVPRCGALDPDERFFYDSNGNEHAGGDRVLVPIADPLPHYNRGRTFVAPKALAPQVETPTSGNWVLHPVVRGEWRRTIAYRDGSIAVATYATEAEALDPANGPRLDPDEARETLEHRTVTTYQDGSRYVTAWQEVTS